MKNIDNGFLYKVNNVRSGRQTIKFHKQDPINDRVQEGTTVEELLRVVSHKLKIENNKNYQAIKNLLEQWQE